MPKLETANVVSKKIQTLSAFLHSWGGIRVQPRMQEKPGGREGQQSQLPETHPSSNETHVAHQESDEGKKQSILVLQIYSIILHNDKDVIERQFIHLQLINQHSPNPVLLTALVGWKVKTRVVGGRLNQELPGVQRT